MNKQKFIEYLRKPADLSDHTLEELEDLVSNYPYFQSARTLLAKASKIKKSKKAGKYVGSAALYATDRALLKRYLNDELIFLSPIKVHESHEADHDRDRSQEIKEKKSASIQGKIKSNPRVGLKPPSRGTVSNVEVKGDAEKPKERPTPKPAPSKPGTKKAAERPKPRRAEPATRADKDQPLETHAAEEKSSHLDELIEELYRDMEELKVSRAKFMKYERQLEEEEAVDEAVKKATTRKDEPADAEAKKSEPAATEDKPAKKEASPEKEDPSASTQETKTPDSPPRKPAESRSARGNRTVTPGKKPDAPQTGKKSTGAKSASKPTAKKKSSSSAKKTTSSTGKGTGKKTESKKGAGDKGTKEDKSDDKGDPKKEEQHSIISEFIKKNPSISPADGKKKNEVDLSGESTAFHPEIASEYLAEIYLKQGKKERAAEIYQSLMLKFPEKKSYFAGLIEKLK